MIQVGDLYLKNNQISDAVRYFVKAADLYTAEGFMGKAIAIYRRILKVNPDEIEIRFRLAELHFRERHTMEGKTLLETGINSYLENGDFTRAIQLLHKLLEFEPQNLQTQLLLAECFEKKAMIPEAVGSYLEIANQLGQDDNFEQSLDALKKAHVLNPRNPAVMLRMISVFLELDDRENAAAFLQDFLSLDLTDPDLLSLLAKTFGNEKQLENLQQFIDGGIPADFRKETFWILMGELYLKRGDLKSAFYQFLMAIEEEARTKETSKGIVLLRKITRLDSSYYPAWRILIDLYTLNGDQEDLLHAYESLTDAYISKAMYEDAADCLQKLKTLEPAKKLHLDKLEFVNSFLEQQPESEEETSKNPTNAANQNFGEIELDESL
jgi:tetratricopeptide (TPR) repeat protein